MANGPGDRDGGTRNRRYKILGVGVIMVSAAYYICLIRGVDLGWFQAYADFMKWSVGIAIVGLSATDAVLAWKSGAPPPEGTETKRYSITTEEPKK